MFSKKSEIIPASSIIVKLEDRFAFCWGDQKTLPLETTQIMRKYNDGLKWENASLRKSDDNKSIIVDDGVNTSTLALGEEGKVKLTWTEPPRPPGTYFTMSGEAPYPGDSGHHFLDTSYFYKLENGVINIYEQQLLPFNERYLAEVWTGRYVIKGVKLRIPSPTNIFTVLDVSPEGANLVNEHTIIHIATS